MRKMKAALVSIIPSVYLAEGLEKSYCMPHGLLYVGSALRRAGFETEIFHIHQHEMSEATARILQERPVFAGFTVLTGVQIECAAKMSREIKAAGGIPVVWGGVHPSLLPEQCLAEDYVDVVVIGEGEESAVELARVFASKGDPGSVRGIGYKDGGRISLTESRPVVKDLDAYRIDWGLIDVREYLRGSDGMLAISTSRGCPYDCTFCYNAKFNGRRWRGHSAGFVASEVQRLKKEYGVARVDFSPDDSFFADPKRAVAIAEAIRLPWCCETRADDIDEALCGRLRSTMCRHVFLGLESGTDRCLDLMRKGFKLSDSLRAITLLSGYPDIEVKVGFILGIPTETWAEMEETVAFALHLKEIHPRMLFSCRPFLPYPGTELSEMAAKLGFRAPQRTEAWINYNRPGTWEPAWLPWMTDGYRERIQLVGRYARLLGSGVWPGIEGLDGLINRLIFKRLATREFPKYHPLELAALSWIRKTVRRGVSLMHPHLHRAAKAVQRLAGTTG